MIPKPGIKTTELWVAVLVPLGSLIAALANELAPRYPVYAGAITGAGYAISRGLTKLGAFLAASRVVVPASPPAPPAAVSAPATGPQTV